MNVLSLKAPHRAVAVLGIHHSGTSCLTGVQHDAILEANAVAWVAPPTRVTWSTERIAAAKQLLADHAGESRFGCNEQRALPVNFLSSRQPLYTIDTFSSVCSINPSESDFSCGHQHAVQWAPLNH